MRSVLSLSSTTALYSGRYCYSSISAQSRYRNLRRSPIVLRFNSSSSGSVCRCSTSLPSSRYSSWPSSWWFWSKSGDRGCGRWKGVYCPLSRMEVLRSLLSRFRRIVSIWLVIVYEALIRFKDIGATRFRPYLSRWTPGRPGVNLGLGGLRLGNTRILNGSRSDPDWIRHFEGLRCKYQEVLGLFKKKLNLTSTEYSSARPFHALLLYVVLLLPPATRPLQPPPTRPPPAQPPATRPPPAQPPATRPPPTQPPATVRRDLLLPTIALRHVQPPPPPQSSLSVQGSRRPAFSSSSLTSRAPLQCPPPHSHPQFLTAVQGSSVLLLTVVQRSSTSGTTDRNKGMINQLQLYGIVNSSKVAEVMMVIDRGLFVPPGTPAYVDSPMQIGYNATISAPHMHATCLELLKEHLQPGMHALDVGSGTGYLTACFAMMVGSQGRAVGVEHIPELVASSIQNIKRSAATELLEGALSMHVADGRLGWPNEAPYDAIHVGAAAREVPQALLDQLKPGGRLVIPVGKIFQDLQVIDKKLDGSIDVRTETSVRYVPLTSRDAQLRDY